MVTEFFWWSSSSSSSPPPLLLLLSSSSSSVTVPRPSRKGKILKEADKGEIPSKENRFTFLVEKNTTGRRCAAFAVLQQKSLRRFLLSSEKPNATAGPDEDTQEPNKTIRFAVICRLCLSLPRSQRQKNVPGKGGSKRIIGKTFLLSENFKLEAFFFPDFVIGAFGADLITFNSLLTIPFPISDSVMEVPDYFHLCVGGKGASAVGETTDDDDDNGNNSNETSKCKSSRIFITVPPLKRFETPRQEVPRRRRNV
ncbi:hypothetical protein RUM43_012359 [Polyplax serrata]|uniref:Uncharacterized protein n=1 Tax=Polyplax serrata TaxID=468196 RepID=A0AAN8S0A6_POLSC